MALKQHLKNKKPLFLLTFSLLINLLEVNACGLNIEALDIPLSIISKNSIIGKGKVIVVTNTSDQYLHECSISINPPNENPIVIPTITPHSSKEIGWLEIGYELRPNDLVSATCKKYLQPYTFKIK